MKALIYMFFALLFLDFPSINDKKCSFELTKTELKKGITHLECGGVRLKNAESYKIKFPRKPTQVLYSTTFNHKVKSFIRDCKPGYYVTLFDIIIEGEKKPPFIIKIVE